MLFDNGKTAQCFGFSLQIDQNKTKNNLNFYHFNILF